ncbi:MAG: 4-phosphoerythronate dehydrogenase [Muribaculaceae bacterium]|nr:4-phosphoerythronate dehydrogenase [Muribaculaceae bacterium]
MKRLLIESHVPYVPDELAAYFDIERVAPADITNEKIKDFDAIIVRTRTHCDASLLDNTRVSIVATATIGIDHFDLPYLASAGIEAVNAPGCNAPAVAQYVFASLLKLYPTLKGLTIGVVGVGNVGGIVAEWGRQLGMNVMLCDPPREEAEGSDRFSDLHEIARKADIITFHTPHTKSGKYPTHHLADKAFFDSLVHPTVIVNAARGPIVDTAALIGAIKSGKVSRAVIDTWENEPEISTELLSLADIATPHIAGYSLNGKIRASMMTINAICRHFDIPYRFVPQIPAGAAERVTEASIKSSYDPTADTEALRRSPATFERQRDSYPLRDEVEA